MVISTGTGFRVVANPDKNTITRNSKKIGTYRKIFGNAGYVYNGFETVRKDAEKIGKFRKSKFGFRYRIIKVPGGYINYTSVKRF